MTTHARLRRLWLLLPAMVLACAYRQPAPQRSLAHVRVLALNDFHGQIEPGKEVDGRLTLGAPLLASWLRAECSGFEGRCLLVSAGDLVSASPPASALLQDEPTVAFLNLLAGDHCAPIPPERRADPSALVGDPRCNLVGTVGNHEFDRGLSELLRLVRGGDHSKGPFFQSPWKGARYPYVVANVVDRRTGAPIFPPAVVRELGSVRVGVVGAVTSEAPALVSPAGVADVAFLDPTQAVNRAVSALSAQGVHAVIVLLHDGGAPQAPYQGPTRSSGPQGLEHFGRTVALLDGDVDVVVSAHTHAFTNVRLPNATGRSVLVTQAFSAGTAFARIDLGIDGATGEVVESSAEIVPAPEPNLEAGKLLTAAHNAVEPKLRRVVATAAVAMRAGPRSTEPGQTGESALGDLVADAYRAAMKADLAFVQLGGLRADLPAGSVTWGDLYAVNPFAGAIVRMTLSGSEVSALLEEQWLEAISASRPNPYILQVSGLSFTWDESRPYGKRIVAIERAGKPLEPGARYTVAVPSFLAEGGDHFSQFRAGRDRVVGKLDTEALEEYLASLPQPFAAPAMGRITRR